MVPDDIGAEPLELIDLHGDSKDRYSWIPFAESGGYDRPHWWDNAGGTIGEPWFVQVLSTGDEVARVQLDSRGGINPTYSNVPTIGDEILEIQFIEVATAARGEGIGTRVVAALAERHPHRRLMAYSEEADDFWASLGWDRFDHPDGVSRALFIQPPR